jgi:hypothetical protein
MDGSERLRPEDLVTELPVFRRVDWLVQQELGNHEHKQFQLMTIPSAHLEGGVTTSSWRRA